MKKHEVATQVAGKNVIVLASKEQKQLKGGTDTQNTDGIIMEDIDVF